LTFAHAEHILYLMEKRVELAHHGPQLWTRELAAKIRTKVDGFLGEMKSGDVLVIDAKGVDVFDFSFANELFGKIILSLARGYPGVFLVVESLTQYTRLNLEKALESIGLALIYRKGRKLELLGKVHTADHETFAALLRAGKPVPASQLKDELGLNQTAINERLSKLADLAIVRRETGTSAAGREQYLYSVPS